MYALDPTTSRTSDQFRKTEKKAALWNCSPTTIFKVTIGAIAGALLIAGIVFHLLSRQPTATALIASGAAIEGLIFISIFIDRCRKVVHSSTKTSKLESVEASPKPEIKKTRNLIRLFKSVVSSRKQGKEKKSDLKVPQKIFKSGIIDKGAAVTAAFTIKNGGKPWSFQQNAAQRVFENLSRNWENLTFLNPSKKSWKKEELIEYLGLSDSHGEMILKELGKDPKLRPDKNGCFTTEQVNDILKAAKTKLGIKD